MDKPSVWFLTYTMADGKKSGASVYLFEFAKRLQQSSFVRIIFITNELGKQALNEAGVNRGHFMLVPTIRGFLYKNYWIKQILLCLQAHKEKTSASKQPHTKCIIFSYSDRLADVVWAYALKRKLKKCCWIASFFHVVPPPLLYFRHPPTLVINDIIRWLENRLVIKIINRGADVIFTESTYIKSYFIDKGYRGKFIILQGGYDKDLFNRQALETKEKKYDACFIGRFFEYKGIYDLLKALILVKKDIANVKLLLIGDGPNYVLERIWKLTLKFDLSNNVVIVKNPTEAEKIKLLKQCKVLVLPSYAEGIPLVFYEAMCLGIPVATYFLPSYADIRTCIIGVKIGHIEELAKALKVLIKNDKLRMLMSRRAELCASGHDWDNLFLSFISQLDSIGVT